MKFFRTKMRKSFNRFIAGNIHTLGVQHNVKLRLGTHTFIYIQHHYF